MTGHRISIRRLTGRRTSIHRISIRRLTRHLATHHRLRTLIVLSAAGLITGLSAGAAYAYFTTPGNGIGSAAVGSMQAVTIAATTATPGNPLLPGGSGDVTLEVTNPNPFPVTLLSVTSSGTITADASHPGCTTTGVTFSQTTVNKAIPASSTTTIDLKGAAAMDTTSSDGCQGAAFSIPVTITVQK
jgi:hypothetical protein